MEILIIVYFLAILFLIIAFIINMFLVLGKDKLEDIIEIVFIFNFIFIAMFTFVIPITKLDIKNEELQKIKDIKIEKEINIKAKKEIKEFKDLCNEYGGLILGNEKLEKDILSDNVIINIECVNKVGNIYKEIEDLEKAIKIKNYLEN